MYDPALALLILKMTVAATVVVSCSILAERSGPFITALVATLPISAGPIYVFLALEHDDAFIAASGLASTYANLGIGALSLAYVLLAQRHGVTLSLGVALACWSFVGAVLVWLAAPVAIISPMMIATFSALHRVFRPYLSARPSNPIQRQWYAIPVRAAGVGLVTGLVSSMSALLGPSWTGLLATFPIVFSSLIVILHITIGGPAAAAVVANSALGLMGFGFAVCAVHLTAEPLGRWWALAIGLAICSGWNFAIMMAARRVNGP